MTARSHLRAAGLALVLIAMTVASYAPALQAGFVWDDDDYVTENPLLSEPNGLARIWFSTDAPSQYVPMVYSVLRIEHSLWGLEPFGYHLVNVLLHAANALLLWLLLARIRAPAAWLVAGVFALHPVQVESVAWIAERKNVLSLLFSLGSMIAWLRFVESDRPHRRGPYLMSLGLHAFALLSKATACTLPAAMLLVPWMRGEAIDRRRIAQVTPFVLLGIGMGLLVMVWERFHIGTQGEHFELTGVEALLVASRACWFYLQKLVWPSQLAFSYPRFEVDAGDLLQYGWLVAGAVLLSALWIWRRSIGREPLAAALLFVATLSPVLGFIPLYTFWYTFVADHYQYVASIGPIALLVGGAARALDRWRVDPGIGVALALLLLSALGTATFAQSRIYESPETLWRDTIAKNPRSWMAHTNLGRQLLAEERWEDAVEAYEAALRIRPETYRAHLGLAKAMWGLGRYEEMRRQYEAALVIEPDLPEVHEHLALRAWRSGDVATAVVHYEALVRLQPERARPHFLLGRALERLGRPAAARARYERALAIDPQLAEARNALTELRSRSESATALEGAEE